MTTSRLLKLLRQIDRVEAVNPYALAFMMTESHFRGALFRALEICWMVIALKILHRAPKLTLGRCQVGFAYWQTMFGSSVKDLVIAVLDDVSNYRVCCQYLNERQRYGLKQQAISYNGRPSALYVRLLSHNLTTIRSLMKRSAIHEPKVVSS